MIGLGWDLIRSSKGLLQGGSVAVEQHPDDGGQGEQGEASGELDRGAPDQAEEQQRDRGHDGDDCEPAKPRQDGPKRYTRVL